MKIRPLRFALLIVATKRPGSARLSATAESWENTLFAHRVGTPDASGPRAFVSGSRFPSARCGDGRVLTGAARIGHDHVAASLIAQIGGEDTGLALRRAQRRYEAAGFGKAERFGEALREILVRVPAVPWIERDDDMDALAARKHREADEADVGKLAADIDGRLLDVGEIEPLIGIEVKDHAVGSFRSEEQTSELQSIMRNWYSVFCLK